LRDPHGTAGCRRCGSVPHTTCIPRGDRLPCLGTPRHRLAATAFDSQTYVPGDSEQQQLAEVLDFITADEQARQGQIEPRYFLAGPEPGERVELPPDVYRVLRQVVEAMRQGMAVTGGPTDAPADDAAGR